MATNAPFVWGQGGAALTPEEIARQREMADALMAQAGDTSPVGHWTQGLARVVAGLRSGLERHGANEASKQSASYNADIVKALMGGGASPAPDTPAAAPAAAQAMAPAAPAPSAPRGVRTNNPGNIKDSDFARSIPGYVGGDGVNARFDSPQAGYAAMDKLLDVYGNKHGLNTVAGILGRWAPAGADNNDTSGYVSYVSKRLGIDPNAPLTPEARAKLPEAMAYFENGVEVPRPAPKGVQVASLTPGLPAAADPLPAPPGAPQAAPAAPAPAPAPVRVAQAMMQGPDQDQIMRVLTDPYASPQTKAVAQALLSRLPKPATPQEQRKQDLEIRKLQREVESPDDKRPSDIREYEYAKGQGFKGTFQEWQIGMKEAGRPSTSVNIDQKAQGALEKNLGEQVGKMFGGLYEEGVQANQDLAQIDRLRGLLAQSGSGIGPALSNVAANFGIQLGEGAGPGQAANAIISYLTPRMRVPGTGATSDKDVVLFKQALPSLMNTPEGNRLIIDTMQGLAEHKRAMGDIAGQVAMQEIDPKEAIARIRALPDPFAGFKTANSGAPAQGAAARPDAVPAGSVVRQGGKLYQKQPDGSFREVQ